MELKTKHCLSTFSTSDGRQKGATKIASQHHTPLPALTSIHFSILPPLLATVSLSSLPPLPSASPFLEYFVYTCSPPSRNILLVLLCPHLSSPLESRCSSPVSTILRGAPPLPFFSFQFAPT